MAKRHPLLKEARAARKFPDNTCSYSRHAFDIGEALMLGKPYSMLKNEPDHCGESIVGTVANLWEARNTIATLKERIAELEAENQRLTEIGAYNDAHFANYRKQLKDRDEREGKQ